MKKKQVILLPMLSALSIFALAGGSATAGLSASVPSDAEKLTTVTPGEMHQWLVQRGGGAGAKTETVEVDLVFNFMKGVGCSDADAKTAADAAAKKANELLKGACVKVNVKEINNDWTGPGNMDDPATPQDEADGEVNSSEIRKAKKEGLKEVTGDDGSGGTKKGYKVFIVKDFVGDLSGTAGCTIKCQPWTAIKKNVANITMGEILAHEMGHSFGKLDDTYDMDDMNCLMYGYVKPGSPRTLKEGEGDTIRGGAKDHGRTVKEEAGAPDAAPKTPKPKATGGISKLESEPVVNPAGEVVYSSINAPVFFDPDPDDMNFAFTVVRDLAIPDPTFIHMGIDFDSNPGSGVNFGPWNGVEFYMQIFYDPITGIAQYQMQDLIEGGGFGDFMSASEVQLLPDEFLPFPAPAVVPIQIQELQLEGVMPIGGSFIVGPQPVLVQGIVSPEADPFFLPQPLDDFFEFQIVPDDFFGRPILQMPGLAGPGDVLPLEGFGFPPMVPVQIFIDDIIVGVTNSDPLGQINLPLPIPPAFFGPGTFDYSFVTAKAQEVGPSGFTWFEHDVPCPADLDGDGVVNAADLAILLAAWGPNAGHIADFNGDSVVNAADLAQLLAAWGPCP